MTDAVALGEAQTPCGVGGPWGAGGPLGGGDSSRVEAQKEVCYIMNTIKHPLTNVPVSKITERVVEERRGGKF